MKKENVLKFLIVLLSLAGCCFTQAQQADSLLFDNRADVEKWIEENHVPALGIVILKQGKLREIRMYGNLKKGTPAPYNAFFNIASLTKPVVTMMTLKLVSNGSWNLDEPLDRYWVDPDIVKDPRYKKLTTRLALSHQTGFKNWRYEASNGKLSFDTTPGVRFGYSGEGFEYLRKALENKFKKGIGQLTDSIIFRPLGMHDTQHAWDMQTDESRFAHWHDAAGNEYKNDYKATGISAADDILTTLEDYGKFAADILQGAGLDTSIFHQMIRPYVPTKRGMHMALGWELMQDIGPDHEYAIFHTGGDAGVQTLIMLLPGSGEGLIVFTNGDNGYKLYNKIVIELLTHGREMIGRLTK